MATQSTCAELNPLLALTEREVRASQAMTKPLQYRHHSCYASAACFAAEINILTPKSLLPRGEWVK